METRKTITPDESAKLRSALDLLKEFVDEDDKIIERLQLAGMETCKSDLIERARAALASTAEPGGEKYVTCPKCGGSGFSGYGTGYDDVCDDCAGNKTVLAEDAQPAAPQPQGVSEALKTLAEWMGYTHAKEAGENVWHMKGRGFSLTPQVLEEATRRLSTQQQPADSQ